MKQQRLLSGVPSPAGTDVIAVAVVSSARTLSKIQKRFNQLVARLKDQRVELARWKEFEHEFNERLIRDYQPVAEKLRQQRIAMLQYFDRCLEDQALGSRQREKLLDIFSQLLLDLLAEAHDEDLVRLYDKHVDGALADEAGATLDELRTDARESLAAASREESAGSTGEQWHHADPERGPPPGRQRAAGGGRSAAKLAKAAESGGRALREVYRKLVSGLHPDREADTGERLRKTDLMKLVNRAYESGDLLRLLEIQLQIEQIQTSDITQLADEKLRHYVSVFEKQSRQLEAQIAELMEPFSMLSEHRSLTALTPEFVRRALDADIQRLKHQVREVKADLLQFQDIRQLKESLRHYRIEAVEEEDRTRRAPRRGRSARR